MQENLQVAVATLLTVDLSSCISIHEGMGRSKSPSYSNKPLKITGGKPLSEAFLNSFFLVFSAEQVQEFERIFLDLEPKLKALKIDGEEFMKQIRDAYKRYQEYKGIDSFVPMDKKGLKYVEDFIRKAIDSTYSGIKKK